MRVAAAVPPVRVADCRANGDAIADMARELAACGAELILFPELSITAYTCADLFGMTYLIRDAEEVVRHIAEATAGLDAVIVAGTPVSCGDALYNCAAVMQHGRVLGLVPKTYLPTYGEFYEGRWFRPGHGVRRTVSYAGTDNVPLTPGILFETPDGVCFGAEICEDLWVPVPPSSLLATAGAHIMLNLSASDDVIGKYDYLRSLVAGQSGRIAGAYVYASAGFGESSTDLVFDGKAFVAENGAIRAETLRWSGSAKYLLYDVDIDAIRHDRRTRGTFDGCRRIMEPLTDGIIRVATAATHSAGTDNSVLLRQVSPTPFVPANDGDIDRRAGEIIEIQAAGLAQRLSVTGCRSIVVGISGGLDSTLALLVATRAFDRLRLPRTGITGITMPGFGTTGRTHDNAVELMRLLGVTAMEIPIGPAVTRHFEDIGHDPAVRDVTYENCQARERTQILMDMANRLGGMMLGTGDMSELALGWATYNGDHMSMYGVNAGVPKTLVRYLVRHFERTADTPALAAVLHDIIDTPISPELIPADADGNITQKTEDLVGPYELHDFFMYHILRYGADRERVLRLALIAFEGRYDEGTVTHWLDTFIRRFYAQQFKRSCMPDGPKVGSICLSPRGDWRMPSDAARPSR